MGAVSKLAKQIVNDPNLNNLALNNPDSFCTWYYCFITNNGDCKSCKFGIENYCLISNGSPYFKNLKQYLHKHHPELFI